MTREYTHDECRSMFIEHLWTMIDYWNTVPPIQGETPATQRDRLSGLAHSILSTIDGVSMSLPAFLLIPAPHHDDSEYHKERGENWWPKGNRAPDIGGSLHEILYKHDPRMKGEKG